MTVRAHTLLLLLLTLAMTSACGGPIEATGSGEEQQDDMQPGPGGKGDIWGHDDRSETHTAAEGSLEWELARSSAALMSAFDLARNEDGSYRVALSGDHSLGNKWMLCDGERFAEQPALATCSATLVAPDLVATSGHCLGSEGLTTEQARCEDLNIVFGFAYTESADDPNAPFQAIPAADVYACDRVEAIGWHRGPVNEDWALIRLDRPVVDRDPVPVLGHMELEVNAPLLQIGHPAGIPQKLASGFVVDPYEQIESTVNADHFRDVYEENTFAYQADILGGNSGGGVFDLESGALAGIPTLYSGKNFVFDDVNGCYETGVCGSNATCAWPPGAYGTASMIRQLTAVNAALLEELTIIEPAVMDDPEGDPEEPTCRCDQGLDAAGQPIPVEATFCGLTVCGVNGGVWVCGGGDDPMAWHSTGETCGQPELEPIVENFVSASQSVAEGTAAIGWSVWYDGERWGKDYAVRHLFGEGRQLLELRSGSFGIERAFEDIGGRTLIVDFEYKQGPGEGWFEVMIDDRILQKYTASERDVIELELPEGARKIRFKLGSMNEGAHDRAWINQVRID